MSRQARSEPPLAELGTERDVVVFTPRGQRALDALAAVLVHRMATTPDGIAYVLEEVMRAPLEDLCAALDAVAAGLNDRLARTDEPAPGRR